MEIEIISCTANPIKAISLAAGTCYGKHDVSAKRVRNCYKSGHMSVFEHASITFRVEGISRACSHQLVRHRLASFAQLSQRYCKVDVESHDWYVMSPEYQRAPYKDNPILGMPADDFFSLCMIDCAKNYSDALEAGIKPEDARYLLPEATKTNITVTMNARELFHFLDLRTSQSAQWEIRELAHMLEAELRKVDGWDWLVDLRKVS